MKNILYLLTIVVMLACLLSVCSALYVTRGKVIEKTDIIELPVTVQLEIPVELDKLLEKMIEARNIHEEWAMNPEWHEEYNDIGFTSMTVEFHQEWVDCYSSVIELIEYLMKYQGIGSDN